MREKFKKGNKIVARGRGSMCMQESERGKETMVGTRTLNKGLVLGIFVCDECQGRKDERKVQNN